MFKMLLVVGFENLFDDFCIGILPKGVHTVLHSLPVSKLLYVLKYEGRERGWGEGLKMLLSYFMKYSIHYW